MAIWATLHEVGRSPAPRRSLVLLVRRLLLGGLAVALALVLAVTPAGAASTGVSPLGGVTSMRDIAEPASQSVRDGDASIGSPVRVPNTPTASIKPGVSTGPPGDGQRQGNVVAVFQDPADPLIVISIGSGYLTVRLRGGSLCPSIHLGDYVVAEGHRRSEAVFDAVEVWVVSP